MPPSKSMDLGFNLFANLDQTSLTKVTAQLSKGVEKGLITKEAAARLNRVANTAAKQFNEIIAGAKLTGVQGAADYWMKKARETDLILSKTFEEMAQIQGRLQEKISKEERTRLLARRQALQAETEALQQQLQTEMDGVQRIIKRRKEAAEEIGKITASKFGEGVQDVFSKFTSKDLSGLTKSLVGGLKAPGGMMEMAGGRMAAGGGAMAKMGPMLAKLGVAVGALAGAAGALALVVKFMVDAEAQAKEFNATIMEGGSAADFAYSTTAAGVIDVTHQLTAAREAALGLAWEFRGNAKEILGVMAAANEAGLTFKEMETRIGRGGNAMEKYADVTRVAIVYSKTLGKSSKEIAEQTAAWVHDLGMGLKDIEKGFSTIFQAAMESGIGVKRFYTMVTEATAGMALYNVRVEEAAALIMTLGKALGEAQAAEFAKGLTKGFAADAYTDRFKKLMIIGKADASEIFGSVADSAAAEFKKKFGESSALIKVAESAGVNLKDALSGDKTELAKLGKMSEKDIRKLLQATESGEQYRQLEQLIESTRGMSGNIGEQAKALDTLSMGGKLAMTLSSGLGGKALSEMTAIELAAYEGYMGLGGEQLMELRKVDRLLRGQWDTIKAAEEEQKREGKLSKETAEKLAKMGVELDSTGKATVKMKDGTLKELKSFNDWTTSQGDVLETAVKKGMTRQEALAKMTAENTASLTNQIETGLQVILEKIYQVMQNLLSWTMKLNPAEVKARNEAIARSEAEEASITALLDENNKKMTEVRERLGVGSKEEQAIAAQELSELQDQRKKLDSSLDLQRKQTQYLNEAQGGGWFGFDKTTGKFVEEGKKRAEEDKLKLVEQQRGKEEADEIRAAAEKAKKEAAEAAREQAEKEREEALTSGEAYTPELSINQRAEQAGAEAYRKAMDEALGKYFLDPKDEQDAQEMALTTAQAPLIEGQTEKLSKDQADEFKELRTKLPGLTEKGYLKALKMREMERASEVAAAATGGDAAEILARLQQGKKLGVSETAAIRGVGMEVAAGMWGTTVGTTLPGAAVGPDEVGQVPLHEDFLFSRGVVTPIDSADQFFGAKPGGAIDQGGMGGTKIVNITLNSPHPAAVWNTVRKAVTERE